MVSSRDLESGGVWAFSKYGSYDERRKERQTYSDVCPATGSTRVKILKRTFKRMFESLTSALERCSTTTKIITLTDAAMRDKRIHGIGGLWKPTIDSKTQRANQ